MAEWKTPIFDRTQEDVDYAMQKIAEWIAADITNASLVGYDLKGCLNVSDINRIEGNIAYLAEQLRRYGYSPNTSIKSWVMEDMPNASDIARILNNVRVLVDSFYQHPDAPALSDGISGYNEVNAIEKNLSLIKALIDGMVDSFKISGTFQVGSTTFLPIRR